MEQHCICGSFLFCFIPEWFRVQPFKDLLKHHLSGKVSVTLGPAIQWMVVTKGLAMRNNQDQTREIRHENDVS